MLYKFIRYIILYIIDKNYFAVFPLKEIWI